MNADGGDDGTATAENSGWNHPQSVVRTRLCAQEQGAAQWSDAARTALRLTSPGASRIAEVEHAPDLLLLVGSAEWAEGAVRNCRATGDITPVVVLNITAEDGSNARILDAGADDCVTSPFDSSELRARVQAVMRRHGDVLARSPDVALDRTTLRIRVRNVEAHVSRRQFAIFQCLAAHREHWVASDEIIATVSGTHHDPSTSLVRVQIHALRKALGAARNCIRCDGHRSYMLTLATATTEICDADVPNRQRRWLTPK